MNYNTSRSDIIIPEYGRNIQLLIEHAKTIENKEERQAFVEQVVDLMQQMHPQARNVEDYISKLWAHVFRIAQYDLEVTAPCDIPPPEKINQRPAQIPYPQEEVKFRHYGRNVQEMIRKATEMEDEEQRKAYTKVIGSYMKMAYKTWNQDNVSDDTIQTDLESMSGGKLELSDDANIDKLITSPQPVRRRKRSSSSNNNNSNKSSRRNTRGGRSSNRRRKK